MRKLNTTTNVTEDEYYLLQQIYALQNIEHNRIIELSSIAGFMNADKEALEKTIRKLEKQHVLVCYTTKPGELMDKSLLFVGFSQETAAAIAAQLNWSDVAVSGMDNDSRFVLPQGFNSTKDLCHYLYYCLYCSRQEKNMQEEQKKQANKKDRNLEDEVDTTGILDPGDAKFGNVTVAEDGESASAPVAYMDTDRKIKYDTITVEYNRTMPDNQVIEAIQDKVDELSTEIINKGRTETLRYETNGIKEEYITPKKPAMDVQKMSPVDIVKYLDTRVYGQSEAKKKAALLLWNHVHGRKRNCLFIGPSGCGKTEIFRALRDLYPQIIIFDSSNITADGWSGSKKVTSVFQVMLASGFSQEDIEKSIIVLDEFDKLCEPHHSSGGENVSAQIQSELLTMIEGTQVQIKGLKKPIDTSSISFSFLGAFESLFQEQDDTARSIGFGDMKEQATKAAFNEEDLIHFGIRTEIMGRIGQIAHLDPLREDDLKGILDDTNISPLTKISKEYGINFVMTEEDKAALARKASENKLGARYLSSEIQKMVDEKLFSDETEVNTEKDLPLIYHSVSDVTNE